MILNAFKQVCNRRDWSIFDECPASWHIPL